MKVRQKYDLRTALALLEQHEQQLVTTNVEVDLNSELAAVYARVGGYGTIQRPTQEGPAMIFQNLKDHPDKQVLIGLVASRKRTGLLLGKDPRYLGAALNEAFEQRIDPITVAAGECQEVIHRADEPGFDIRKIIPALQTTPDDAGPYITMGLCYASDPETHESDITIHRLCLQNDDEMTMFFTPGIRHLDAFRKKAEAAGHALPITINIGVDPAIEVAACFEPPTTPLGFNELTIAGGLRQQAVELVQGVAVAEKAIAHAEYVIEGEIVPDKRMREDSQTFTGKAMPEFPGYTGEASPSLPVIKVKAVTHRKNPLMRACIGSSEEHVNLAGIPTEASILNMIEKAMPGKVQNVYCATSGGGKYVAIIQFKKKIASDEGRQRQAALVAFAAFSELKHVYLVDEDVDIFDWSDVMWAMTTRFQADVDCIPLPGVRCHPLDPSNDPAYAASIRDRGIATKAIFDCTVPFHLKDQFKRSEFIEVDVKKWLK